MASPTACVSEDSDRDRGSSTAPTLKESNSSVRSAGSHGKVELTVTPTSQLAGFSTLKTILLVFTMTMAMIVNVRISRCLESV